MSFHVLSWHMSYHAMSSHKSCHVIWYVMWYIMSCDMSYHVICHVNSYIKSCYMPFVMSYHMSRQMSGYILFHMSCHAIHQISYVMLCHIMSYNIKFIPSVNKLVKFFIKRIQLLHCSDGPTWPILQNLIPKRSLLLNICCWYNDKIMVGHKKKIKKNMENVYNKTNLAVSAILTRFAFGASRETSTSSSDSVSLTFG